MDEGAREASSLETSESEERTPDQIRDEIDQTREELGDTVEALAQKADVKSRAKERVEELKGTAQQKKEEFVAKAKAQSPDSAATGAKQLGTKAQDNPLPFAVGGALLAGFALGRLTSR